jgi:hypothetical protein
MTRAEMETRVQAVIAKIAPPGILKPLPSHRVKARQYRVWTAEERAMLAMMWQTPMPLAEIASVLDRTEMSCQQQASLMGVKRPVSRPHRPKDWTRNEDCRLVEARHAGVPYAHIVIGGRTPMQMKNRMAELRRKGAI